MGASPTVVGEMVVLVCDQATGSFMEAVGKDDGCTGWRTDTDRLGFPAVVALEKAHSKR
jgi:hypothetical protein